MAQVDAVVPATIPGAPDVYLVPGTWAAGILRTIFARELPPPPDWTTEDSQFVESAKASFRGSAVFRVIWGGRNLASDRSNGAAALRGAIGQDPEREKIIICHSHGGGLAFESLSKGALGVKGVVCMNTPFFAYLFRNTEYAFSTAFFFLLMSGLVWMPALPGTTSHRSLFAVVWGAVLVLAILKGRTWIMAKAQTYEMHHSTTNIDDCRVLCLTTREDEAFGLLNLTDSIGNLPFMLIGKWSPWLFLLAALGLTTTGRLPLVEYWKDLGLAPPLPTFAWTGLGVLVVVGLVVWGILVSRFLPHKWSTVPFVVLAIAVASPWWLPLIGLPWHLAISHVVSGWAWAGLAFLLLLVLTFPVVVISRFLAQGIWDPVAPYFVRVLVTLTPIVARRVKFVELEPGPQDMNHAMLHRHADRAWKEIMKWKEEEFGG